MTTYHTISSKTNTGISIYTSNVPEPTFELCRAGEPNLEQWMPDHCIGGLVGRHVLIVMPCNEESTPELHPFGTCWKKFGDKLCEICCDALAESIQAEQIAAAVAAERERIHALGDKRVADHRSFIPEALPPSDAEHRDMADGIEAFLCLVRGAPEDPRCAECGLSESVHSHGEDGYGMHQFIADAIRATPEDGS